VLLTNELVANVVEHTQAPSLLLELVYSDGWLRVSVTDSSGLRPIVYEMGRVAHRGRGMQIVASMAQRWGIDERARRQAGLVRAGRGAGVDHVLQGPARRGQVNSV
jgi:anti-sigma regulatory factor (Ser/Thr protein kinase)